MVIDGVLELFDDIALDCKDFQPDDIYTCVIGNEFLICMESMFLLLCRKIQGRPNLQL